MHKAQRMVKAVKAAISHRYLYFKIKSLCYDKMINNEQVNS